MIKNLTITTKQVAVAKRMYVKSSDCNNKQNMIREIAENHQGTTRKSCERQKNAKVRNWAGKITQAVHESTTKNKATKELYMQWQKSSQEAY